MKLPSGTDATWARTSSDIENCMQCQDDLTIHMYSKQYFLSHAASTSPSYISVLPKTFDKDEKIPEILSQLVGKTWSLPV